MSEVDVPILTWRDILQEEKNKPYFKQIMHFLKLQRTQGKVIYPVQSDIFNAIKFTPYDQVKVVIVGQDPYHGPQQAHGLSFSVRPGIAIPASLLNIYKELESDLGIPRPAHGCLEHWAKQGVLLLNAVLTVEAGKPQSHAHIGWQQFTDHVIQSLNHHPERIVFLLWGSYAQRKIELIDTKKHVVLQAPHPSPLSAHRGFLGCRHFSKANDILQAAHRTPIDWAV